MICIYEARFEAAFPKCAGASMSTIKRGNIVLPELTHGVRQCAGSCGTNEQVNVIAHKNIGMDCHVVVARTFAKKH